MKGIERLRCDFLWNDIAEKRKFHPVSWTKACQPVARGGLGICSLSLVNNALLGKWLWRLGDSSLVL